MSAFSYYGLLLCVFPPAVGAAVFVDVYMIVSALISQEWFPRRSTDAVNMLLQDAPADFKCPICSQLLRMR